MDKLKSTKYVLMRIGALTLIVIVGSMMISGSIADRCWGAFLGATLLVIGYNMDEEGDEGEPS